MIEDRKFVHDMRNSMMVIRNLSELLQQDMLKGEEKKKGEKLIIDECNKVLEMLK
jgi:hypothetical protein